jgi:hypothetical protein
MYRDHEETAAHLVTVQSNLAIERVHRLPDSERTEKFPLRRLVQPLLSWPEAAWANPEARWG